MYLEHTLVLRARMDSNRGEQEKVETCNPTMCLKQLQSLEVSFCGCFGLHLMVRLQKEQPNIEL